MSVVPAPEAPDASAGLGRRIADARRRAGLTQAALARRIGTSLWSVERMERGDRDATPYVPLIAAATGAAETQFRLPSLEPHPVAATREGHPKPTATFDRRRARLRLGTAAPTWGRTAVLGTIAVLVLVRLFSEKLHVVPKIATFVDIPLFVLLVVLAIGLGKGRSGSRTPFLPLSMAFLAIVVLSTLANVERIAVAPALVFVYGFLAPIALYFAVYRLWPPGNAGGLTRLLVLLGAGQFAVVALFDLPRFLATQNSDLVSGTFGDNAYQLVFFLLVLTALFAGIRMWEPTRLTARLAPVFFVVVAAIVFLAQYRALLVATLVCVLLIALFLTVGRSSGIVLGAVVFAAFAGSLTYVAARFPVTKLDQTVAALQKDPLFFVDARLAPIRSVSNLYSDDPRFVVTGSGPGTYSSRAWRTFADVRETRTAVAAPYAAKIQGRPYTTDVSEKHIVPRIRTSPSVQGSYAVSLPFSSYAALLAEVGVLGFVLLAGAYAAAAVRAGRLTVVAIRRRARDDPLPAILLSATIAFALLLQLALLENWWEVTRVTFLSWTLLAVGTKEFDARAIEDGAR